MDEVRIYMSHSLRYFLIIAIPAVFGLSALAKPLIAVLTTPDFISGWFVIPITAFAGLMAGIFQIFVNTMFLRKETKPATYINIVAAVTNVILNLILIPIPSIGILGAALSTLISYTLMAAFCVHISLKHFKLDFYYLDIAKSILSSMAMYFFVTSFTISGIFELFEATGTGIIVYLVVMLLVGGFTGREISLIKKYLFRSKVNPNTK